MDDCDPYNCVLVEISKISSGTLYDNVTSKGEMLLRCIEIMITNAL